MNRIGLLLIFYRIIQFSMDTFSYPFKVNISNSIKHQVFAWNVAGLVLLFTIIPGLTVQAETLSLQQAIDEALSHNRTLENAGMEVDKAADGVAAEKTKILPKLKFDASEMYNLSPQTFSYQAGTFGVVPTQDIDIVSQDGFTTILSVGLKQPLSQLYRLGLSIDQKEIMKDIAGQQFRANRLKVIKQVKSEYYTILKTQFSLQAAEQRTVFFESLSELVNNYYQQQTVLQYQTLEVQAKLARSEHEVYRLKDTLKTEQERLNLLLGRDVSAYFTVQTVVPEDVLTLSQQQVEYQALSHRPELKETELKHKHAKYGYKIKQSEYLPDLDLEVRYTRLFGTDFIPDQESFIGLRLGWDIYDWGRKQDDLSQKHYTIQQTRNQIRETKERILVDVNEKYRKLQQSRDLIKVTELSRDAAGEKVRVLMNQYRQQSVLLDDVLRAEADYTDANSEFHRALLSVWTARAELDKAMGVD